MCIKLQLSVILYVWCLQVNDIVRDDGKYEYLVWYSERNTTVNAQLLL